MGERARRAEDYFRQVAGRWDELRALYVHDDEVERQLAALIAEEQVAALLDIGTGTGRILEILADKVAHAVGIDLSPDRSEEHTSELQSLMRISYAVFCLNKKQKLFTSCTVIQHTTRTPQQRTCTRLIRRLHTNYSTT